MVSCLLLSILITSQVFAASFLQYITTDAPAMPKSLTNFSDFLNGLALGLQTDPTKSSTCSMGVSEIT
jgi:hypothetical protein